MKWIEEQRRLEIGITTNDIIYKAIQLKDDLKEKNYYTLHSWCHRFLKRYSYSIR